MVCALVSGLRGLGSRPCRVNVLCSFGETLNFQSASLSPPRSIDGYRRIVKEAYEIRGGDNLGRLVFKVRFARTYVEGLLRAYITHLYEMWAGRILKS